MDIIFKSNPAEYSCPSMEILEFSSESTILAGSPEGGNETYNEIQYDWSLDLN